MIFTHGTGVTFNLLDHFRADELRDALHTLERVRTPPEFHREIVGAAFPALVFCFHHLQGHLGLRELSSPVLDSSSRHRAHESDGDAL